MNQMNGSIMWVACVSLLAGCASLPASKRLRASTTLYMMARADSAGVLHPLGTLERRVSIDERSGIVTVVHIWAQQDVAVDTTDLDLATLAPRRYRGWLGDSRWDLTFSTTHVAGTRVMASGARSAVEVTLPPGTFSEVVDDIVVRTRTLAIGDAFRYMAYSPGEAPRQLDVRVVRRETVRTTDGRTVDTWVVEQRGIHDLVVTWWFATDTGGDVLMRIASPSGPVIWRIPLYVKPVDP
jgi:hypothetical protein